MTILNQTPKGIYKIGYKTIRITKLMVFDRCFKNINSFDLVGSILLALKNEIQILSQLIPR